jgi:hypothetical protein
MTHPVYSRQQLQGMKRPQLWEICTQLGIHRFAKIEKLVEAILEKMPQLVEAVEEIIVQAEPKPEAKIINDDENYEPWVLISDGVVITRGKTYLQVFNSPDAKEFEIINIDNQTCFNSLAVWQENQTVIARHEEEIKARRWQEAETELSYISNPLTATPSDINEVVKTPAEFGVHTMDEEYIDPETSRPNIDEPVEVAVSPQNKKKGLSVAFVCELNDETLYAVNFNGVLIGYICHRGSGRRDFFALTMSANNQRTVISLSADRQHDRVDDTDNASAVTLEKVLLTTR